MRDRSRDMERWSHEIERHDWYNDNEFNSYRPQRRYYRTSPGPYEHHQHHEHPDHPDYRGYQDERGRRARHFNRFDEDDHRYVMRYDLGRGGYHASHEQGYANTPRSTDRDWDDGRNVYWRERYHHQGHPEDRHFEDRYHLNREDWEDERDRYAHRRGYSSNYRDHNDHGFRGRDWRIDDDYYH